MKIFTADRETGTFIEECESVEQAQEFIKNYEAEDMLNDLYEKDFYNIVNENHETIR